MQLYARPNNYSWVDITLNDTIHYTSFSANAVNNPHYPLSNLFDADFKTCWVANNKTNKKTTSIFIKLPDTNVKTLNIFSGYGKNKALYYQNCRPRKIRLSVYAGVNPEGYVSENTALYKAVKFLNSQIIKLKDSFIMQHIKLDFSQIKLIDFRKSVYKTFYSNFKQSIANTCLIMQLEILDIWQGSKYNDICISEIFFDDRFIPYNHSNSSNVKSVYLNSDENTLLVDYNNAKGVSIYRDTTSVLQIVEISENKKWAILISMPAKIQGRVETTYLLVDLVNKEVVNSQLENCTGNHLYGNEMHFEYNQNDMLYLKYNAIAGEYHKIELM